ncbi:DUF2971 domain-containing protein [Proteus mirabilis]|uniref:DUF2971 domain-containing protein n=1 Tax=Proteus mirabilis TaxID=584 RepID=UPI000D563FA3|nr:DUF2971 domain-containing protein [Proteus mirabilis]EKX4941187.1 DUF2971 domain-containing protein [Proteus mirabilis]EKX6492920.1 DUF2971 domain-containing protein [Proteus mirabilis]ELI8899514.1 DUF2971 domain-containing protein [Proteus mirabilis]MBG2749709.1 DUF2971 domain-containing protein [Proteus mirabilis]MBG3033489.1 DUF2971 domain-containing protein [Proteus mirabilis]
MSFYKYMTTETGKIVIEQGTLRWSSPSIFNDIDECQFSPFTDSELESANNAVFKVLANCVAGHLIYNFNEFSDDKQMMIELLKYGIENGIASDNSYFDSFKKIVPSMEDFFREYINIGLINCARVLCVTSDYDNNLMWAHYADEHRGCVLEFENVYKEAPDRLHQGPVKYVDELKSSTNAIELLLYGETKSIHNTLIKDVFFSKKSAWQYEKEYRLLFSENFGVIQGSINCQTNEKTWAVSGQSDQLYTDVEFAPDSLLSITFGVRTQAAIVDEIISIARSKNPLCTFYQMIRSGGSTVRHRMQI